MLLEARAGLAGGGLSLIAVRSGRAGEGAGICVWKSDGTAAIRAHAAGDFTIL
jgi:hypothetical protein